MKREEVIFLKQLVASLEESEAKLRKAYETQDIESFSRIKRFMLQAQSRIARVLK